MKNITLQQNNILRNYILLIKKNYQIILSANY